MNCIYRLIWNTTLACWVVASEHTRSRGKRTRSVRAAAAAFALALPPMALAAEEAVTAEEDVVTVAELTTALLQENNEALLDGAVFDVAPAAFNRSLQATVNDTYFANATLRGENSLVLGSRASVTGNRSTGIGNEVVIDGGGHTVLGSKASAIGGRDAVAIGINATAAGIGNVAIGVAAQAETAAGIHAVAIGAFARAGSPGWTGAVAVGGETTATNDGVALGFRANAQNYGAMSLGRESVGHGVGALAVGRYAKALAEGTIAIGSGAEAPFQYGIAIGAGAQSQAAWGTALGHLAKAGEGSHAMGYMAQAGGRSSVAMGWVTGAHADESVAIGAAASVGSAAHQGIALGAGGHVAALQGSALGADAIVVAGANRAVALGAGSVANADDTVSVGSASLKRRIVNLADGELSAASTDAVTGKQLHAVANRLDGPNIVIGEGAVSAGERAVVIGQGGQVYGGSRDAIAIGTNAKAGAQDSTGGIAIGGSSTSSYNGVALGHNASASALDSVALGARSIATESHTVSVGSAAVKRRIVNVGDGTLSATSTEAVTGKQLFNTNQNVSTALNTANTAKITADAAKVDAVEALGKANHLSGLVSEVAPNGSMRLGGENAGFVVDVRNSNGVARTLSGVAAGALHATSSDAVNGAQLSAINDRVELHAVAIGVNRLEIGVNRDDLAELREAFENFEPDLTGVVRYNDDRTLVDLDGAGVTGLAAGELSATSRDAVNGAQLFGTNERVEYLEQQQRYVAVGADEFSGAATAGPLAVAIGSDAKATVDGATAIGSFASAQGVNSVALGRGALVRVGSDAGFALGTNTEVAAAGGLAIGALSSVGTGATRAVALGNESVAGEIDTISVGNDNLKRRIVNLGRGTAGADATTIAQLTETLSALGGGAGIDATGRVIAPNYVLSGDGYTNVGDALTFLDTKLVSQQDELDTLDTRYKALVQNDRSIRYNEDRSVVDFGGARLTGVAAGSVNAESSEAVNGAQLFTTNERVGGIEDKQRMVMVGPNGTNGAAHAEEFGVAVGGDAAAGADGATAVGSFATALGANSVALGRGSYVAADGRDGFALGSRTRVQSVGGLAIGSDADVMSGADQSVALGTASVAKEAHTVSVGSGEYRRRIVSVAQGIKPDDATTVSQLRGTLAALGGGADLDAKGNVIGPRYAVQGSEYGSFGDAITALDGSVGDNKRNLDTLDSRFQRLFQESPSANADGPGRLSFGGAQGMVLGNVANGLIGQGSRDAVNGGQLWAVKEDLQGQIDALDPGKSEVSGSPLAMNARSGSITPSADDGSQLVPPEANRPAADPGTVAAQDPLVKAEGDNAVAVGSEGKERQVKHVAEGRADTDAANVRQVNDALERANAYTDSAVASVNQRLDQVDKRINRMAAISSAQSAMAMNTAGLATANRLGAGVGYSEGESAMAVGYQRVLTERGSATFSLNGAFTNSGEKSVGVGVGIGW